MPQDQNNTLHLLSGENMFQRKFIFNNFIIILVKIGFF